MVEITGTWDESPRDIRADIQAVLDRANNTPNLVDETLQRCAQTAYLMRSRLAGLPQSAIDRFAKELDCDATVDAIVEKTCSPVLVG